MPVFTFSTRDKKIEDTDAVKYLKEYCDKHNLYFSEVVTTLIKDHVEVLKDERSRSQSV